MGGDGKKAAKSDKNDKNDEDIGTPSSSREKRGQGEAKKLCGRCNKECTLQSEGLPCALCRQWFHIKCMDNATSKHLEMGDMIYHLFGTGRFLCNTCMKVAPRLNGDLMTIRAKVEEMEQREATAAAERAAMNDRSATSPTCAHAG